MKPLHAEMAHVGEGHWLAGRAFVWVPYPLKKRAADEERLRAVSLSDHWISRGMAGQLIQPRACDSRHVGSGEIEVRMTGAGSIRRLGANLDQLVSEHREAPDYAGPAAGLRHLGWQFA
jgi:hypothetical protein